MNTEIKEKIPKMVNGYFKIELIDADTNEIIDSYEENNKVLIWVYQYFSESVFGYAPPNIDDFRIHSIALGTDGEVVTSTDVTPKDIPIDQHYLFSEENFWNGNHTPPENSYVYQVTFSKPSSYDFKYADKMNEGATWPHISNNPKNYRGDPWNYEDEIEAGISVRRGFQNGILSQEIYLGKLAGNGHPMWENAVRYSEAALYMTDGATEDGRTLGTIFSMKTFPGMVKTDACVLKITWNLSFEIN